MARLSTVYERVGRTHSKKVPRRAVVACGQLMTMVAPIGEHLRSIFSSRLVYVGGYKRAPSRYRNLRDPLIAHADSCCCWYRFSACWRSYAIPPRVRLPGRVRPISPTAPATRGCFYLASIPIALPRPTCQGKSWPSRSSECWPSNSCPFTRRFAIRAHQICRL